MKPTTKAQLLAAILGVVFTAELAAQPTAFTYQGELRDNGQPASGIYDLRFTIHDSAGGGTPVAGPITNSAVLVSNGLFTVMLDFGPGVFTGANRWLEIGARDGGSAGPFEVLAARQPLRPAPYALHAYSVTASNVNGVLPDAAIPNSVVRASGPQIFHGPVRFEDVVEFMGGEGGPPFSLTYRDVIPGLNAAMLGDRTAEGFWQTGGNAGTTPGADFLGTIDNQPLDLKVNGLRALRLVPTGAAVSDMDSTPDGAPNFIAGSPANVVIEGVVGATISGGGATNFSGRQSPNEVASDYSTIGGGRGNAIRTNAWYATISGGVLNVIQSNSLDATIGGGGDNAIGADSGAATIAGGIHNTIHYIANGSTIGGGSDNQIMHDAQSATVGGGHGNSIGSFSSHGVIAGGRGNSTGADANGAVIGGGGFNTNLNFTQYTVTAGGRENVMSDNTSASSIGGGYRNIVGSNVEGGCIPGGFSNMVNGSYGLAAGNRAKALHTGTFVWADSTVADFPSSSSNQFLVRATGGVGINTTNPAAALDVRVLDSEAASVHVGGEGVNGLGKLIYFGDIPYVSIGEQGVDDQMVLTAGSFYFDNRSGSGRVGLGRSATANKLEVEGEASKTTAGSWLANSDRRIKRDIQTLTNALDTLAKVRPVRFRYTAAYRAGHPAIADREYVNVVAQEFEAVFPEFVKRSGETLPEGVGEEIRQVDTYPLLIYGTAAIQELNRKVETGCQRSEVTENRLQKLEAENAELKARLERLEHLVARQFAKGQ